MILGVALRKESVDRNDGIPYSAAIRRASLSVRRAWIEICHNRFCPVCQWSLSVRRAWIEINVWVFPVGFALSLSVRRAWIEIVDPDVDTLTDDVALRKESVDRNVCQSRFYYFNLSVALRKESVDRNNWIKKKYPGCRVALRKESVDRNFLPLVLISLKIGSLSVRRAWIEIHDFSKIAKKILSRSP